MHPNLAFHTASADQNLDFARKRGFAQLSVNGPDGPLAAHVPVLISEDGKTADLHLVRSNPIVRALPASQPVGQPAGQPAGQSTPQSAPQLPALCAFSGPDAYISPDWYDAPDQVPTWNYVAVHLRGTLALLPPDALPDLLARQSAALESRLAPKPPWLMDKVASEALGRMMRMIVPLRLTITAIDGTWKLGQNKTDAIRANAAREVVAGFGLEVNALAELMREIPPNT